MQSLKPDGAKLDELNGKVDAAIAKLDRLQAVTEGRLDSAISTLRANLAGVSSRPSPRPATTPSTPPHRS